MTIGDQTVAQSAIYSTVRSRYAMNPDIFLTPETIKNTVYALAQANTTLGEAKLAGTSLGCMLVNYLKTQEASTDRLSSALILEIELVLINSMNSRKTLYAEVAGSALRVWRLELKRYQRSEWRTV